MDDTRIAVYLLQHNNDGDSTANHVEEAELLNRFKLFDKVRSTAASDQNIECLRVLLFILYTFIPPEYQQLTTEVQKIVELVYNHVWDCIEGNLDHQRRKSLISDIYDGNMGFIEPTVVPLAREIPDLKISEDTVSGRSPRQKHGSPRNKKGWKRREKRVGLSASSDAEGCDAEGIKRFN